MTEPKKEYGKYWWDNFRKFGADEYYDFFCSDEPSDLKSVALQFLIWEDLVTPDLVRDLVPSIVNIDLFSEINYDGWLSQLKINGIIFSFRKGKYINVDTLRYLFDIYPIKNDKKSKKTIINLFLDKMSLMWTIEIIKNQSIKFSTKDFKKISIKIGRHASAKIKDILYFIDVCLETSQFKFNKLNKIFSLLPNMLDYDNDTLDIWRAIGDLFIRHGYDPSHNTIDITDDMPEIFFEYLAEIMDINVLAKRFIEYIGNRERVDGFTVYSFLKILAKHHFNLNLLFDN